MYFVGIDWADQKHAVAVLDETAEKILGFNMEHNNDGFVTLEKSLLKISSSRENFAIIIETNNGLLVEWLLAAGFPVYPVNPKLANARRKASGAKTDPLDAIILANLGRSELRDLRRLVPNSEVVEELRSLTRAQVKLISTRTSWINRLKSSLKKYYPVALELFTDIAGPVSLAFVYRYSTLKEAQQATQDEIEAFLRRLRYPYAARKAESLHALLGQAHLSAASTTVLTECLWSRSCIQQVSLLNEQIQAYEEAITELFERHSASKIFASLPGAGKRLAPCLLAEWGDDPKRYESAAVVQALAGTSPVLFQSGKYRLAKQRKSCVKQFRRALHLFAFQTIKGVPWARQYYDKKRREGKGHHTALRALANVWVRIIFAMTVNQEEYCEEKYLKAKMDHLLAA